jgi:hypothetical protein
MNATAMTNMKLVENVATSGLDVNVVTNVIKENANVLLSFAQNAECLKIRVSVARSVIRESVVATRR